MKKSMLLVAAIAISMSGSAHALTSGTNRAAAIPGVGAAGIVSVFAWPGVAPVGTCRYILNWHSPFVPNDTLRCDVLENQTALHPTCSANALADVGATVSGGPIAAALFGAATSCQAFDPAGNKYAADGVSLILSEQDTGAPAALNGTVIYPGTFGVFGPLPITM